MEPKFRFRGRPIKEPRSKSALNWSATHGTIKRVAAVRLATIEYPTGEFIAKLRRLADALEQGTPFEIQIAGERIYVPVGAVINIEHEREGDEEEIEFQLKWKRR